MDGRGATLNTAPTEGRTFYHVPVYMASELEVCDRETVGQISQNEALSLLKCIPGYV